MGVSDDGARTGRRKWVRVLVVVVLTVGVVTGVGGFVALHGHHPAVAPPAPSLATAVVTRTDLSISQSLPGTLGFGTQTPVTGKGTGVLTGLPASGATISRGQALYQVNEQPVVVFYGDTPLFRTLSLPATPPPGSPPSPPLVGQDVTVVADNLRALGYQTGSQPPSSATTGDTYTPALASAVTRWEKATGLPATGTLDPASVIVVPGQVRVDGVQAHLGDAATEQVLTLTATSKVITVPVAVTDQNGIAVGDKVGIALPDGSQIQGSVTAISSTIQSNTGQGNQNSPPTVDVTVTPANNGDVARWNAAPVTVTFTTGVHRGVLAVPINALLALRGGGYALQRTDGTLLAVSTGMFASGMVEVSGAGIGAGLRVRTAAS